MVEKETFSLSKLLRSILSIAVLGFGGGAAVIPLYHKEFVEKYGWFSDDDFQDILSVANALPGPIQTKIAGYIGYKLKGFLGLIISLLGIILPSLIVMLIFYNAINYYKDKIWVSAAISSVFPVVTVLMFLLTISFFNKSRKKLTDVSLIVITVLSIIMLVIFDINPAVLIIIILVAVFVPLKKDNYRYLLMYTLGLAAFLFGFLTKGGSNGGLGLDLSDMSQLFKVCYAFFVPGILGYGGGPGSLSLISYEIVDHVQLLTSDQFALIVGIQASLPGVTATKLAGTIGYQIAGFMGSLLSILVYVTPSMILMITLLNLLNKYKSSPLVIRLTSYVGPVIVVLLGQLTYNFLRNSINAWGWVVAVLFIGLNTLLLKKFKIHPFFAILISMILGILYTIIL